MAETIEQIPVADIAPDPHNPRGQLTDDDPKVQEFAAQLQQNSSIYQPLRLLRLPSGYRIIIGERRWRAARLAGLATVPAIVQEQLSEQDVREQQLAEMAQQNEVPTHRQYEAWAEHVGLLVGAGVPRARAIEQVAKIVGKSPRTVGSAIGQGYVEAPTELKQMVQAGEIGPAVVGILNAGGLADEDRVRLARKIGQGVIRTTGTTIQSELMPRIRRGYDIAKQLIQNPRFSLEDARRLETARDLAAREEQRHEQLRRAKENERQRPRTMGDVGVELEKDLLELTSKLRTLNDLELVPDLPVAYLQPTLRIFHEQWERFRNSLPPSALDAADQLPALASSQGQDD